jgi:hypothetical protein
MSEWKDPPSHRHGHVGGSCLRLCLSLCLGFAERCRLELRSKSTVTSTWAGVGCWTRGLVALDSGVLRACLLRPEE